MRNPTPTKALRVAMKMSLGVVRLVQWVADRDQPELEPLREHFSRGYAELRKQLEAREAKETARG